MDAEAVPEGESSETIIKFKLPIVLSNNFDLEKKIERDIKKAIKCPVFTAYVPITVEINGLFSNEKYICIGI